MLTPVQSARACPSYRRAMATNGSGTLAALAPTTTQPEVLARQQPGGGWAPQFLRLVPIGAGADNAVFTLQVVGWSQVAGLLVPVILFEAVCTLSTCVGVAGQAVPETERFADTIADPTAGKGVKNVDCVIGTPADNTPANVVLDTRGCEFVQVRVGSASGAITGNALYAWA